MQPSAQGVPQAHAWQGLDLRKRAANKGDMQLERRSQWVLQLVIETYIDTAQPVSSQALVAKLAAQTSRAQRAQPKRRTAPAQRGLSAANLRAMMAELESAGLLMQPHKSAGRIPTETGLRLYVDTLLAPRLHPWDRSRLDAGSQAELPEELAAYVGQQLARLTGQAAMVAVPSFLGVRIRELGLVHLGGSRILAYFVAPAGHVQQKVVELERSITAGELLTVQNLLNAMLEDRTLQQMRAILEVDLKKDCSEHGAWQAQAMAVGRRLWPEPSWKVVVEGTAELLLQPEFADRGQLHELLQAISQKAIMLTLVDEMLAHPGVLVRLGSEHALPAMPHVAYVGCGTAHATGESAAVGLFGPCRMDYGRVVPLVQYASQMLARFYAAL